MNATNAHETSLSRLTHSEWCQIQSRWMRGIDWCVEKIGRKWRAQLGSFPLFTTKTAAYDAVTELVLAESRWRAANRKD